MLPEYGSLLPRLTANRSLLQGPGAFDGTGQAAVCSRASETPKRCGPSLDMVRGLCKEYMAL